MLMEMWFLCLTHYDFKNDVIYIDIYHSYMFINKSFRRHLLKRWWCYLSWIAWCKVTLESIGRSRLWRIIYQTDKLNVHICSEVSAVIIYKLVLVGQNLTSGPVMPYCGVTVTSSLRYLIPAVLIRVKNRPSAWTTNWLDYFFW